MTNKLFISKSIKEIETLADFCTKNQYGLFPHSFLQFESIPFKINQNYQAIFFGSPRAVDFFLAQESIPNQVYIGCIGEITANHLRLTSYEPHFTGKMSGDASQVALDFKNQVGDKIVFFPQSSSSNRTISSVFDPQQIIEMSIYKTILVSKSIPNCDYYVFTSPSNVDGFLLENEIANDAKVIAWGKTTEKYLISKNLKVYKTLANSSIADLIKILK